VFDPARTQGIAERRKRSGHLISKHRFIAAQMQAFLADGLWLALARHANSMADRLAEGLAQAGIRIVWSVEANEVFAVFPRRLDARLRAAGASYYEWSTNDAGAIAGLTPDSVLVRLVTSFATTEQELDRFLSLLS